MHNEKNPNNGMTSQKTDFFPDLASYLVDINYVYLFEYY